MQITDDAIATIQEQGILPLYYDDDKEVSVSVLRALYQAGIKAVEYTNRGAYAFENFNAMKALCQQEMPDMKLGIGTIKNVDDAKRFAAAGADFIICPGVVPAIADVAKNARISWIPGCLTPTEIIMAEQCGAKLVKLFPGSLLGASYVSAIKDIFPDLLFMPTGGVEITEGNISGWLKAGVCAVGLGSKVISKELLKQKDYKTIGDKAKEALNLVARLRNSLAGT